MAPLRTSATAGGRQDDRARLGRFGESGLRRPALWSTSASLPIISLLILIAFSSSANAACTPAAADGVTSTCTGITAGTYGNGSQTGVTVIVAPGATLQGPASWAIHVADGTFINNTGAAINGGILTAVGDAAVTNSGGISAGPNEAVVAFGNLTLTNNTGGTLTGQFGVGANLNATVTNNAGAFITGGNFGVHSVTGAVNVTNAGSIIAAGNSGLVGAIVAATNATVVNAAGGNISGGTYGIYAANGFVNLTNSGTVNGTTTAVRAQNGATITNNAGGIISAQSIGLWVGSAATVTNFGSITSNSTAVLTGAGISITNGGTISGVTAIQFGSDPAVHNTLTLLPGSAISGTVYGSSLGNDVLQLGGTGADTIDISTLGAQYRRFGTFNKIDSSVWTLTGTSSFAGPVNVNGGTLSVSGDLSSASSLTVNAGGTLGGNGTVGSTTINGGTLAPGNSIGLLTVSGSLTLTAASSYLVEVSPANADRVNVTGLAILGGATVNASFASGSYVAKQYTILNAGSINGNFAGPVNTNLPSGFTSSLSYDTNNVYLNLTLGFTTPDGLNINQQNVANALTGFFDRTGGIPLAFGALTPAGLTQASGEVATGAQQTTFDAANLFLGLLTDPFMAGRGAPAGGGAGASPFAADDADALAYADIGRKPRTASGLDTYAAVYRKAPLRQLYEPRWSVWAAGFGGTQTTDGNSTLGSNTATSRIAQAAVGADYWFSPDTVAGFALAGGGNSFSVANGGTGRSDMFQAGAFVRHNVGPAYVTGALAYGWQDVTTDRIVTVTGADHLHARFDANSYSGRLEGGYRIVAPWTGGVGLTPYAAAQFTTFDLPAYAEQAISGTNTFALSYASKSVTATLSELGLRADKSFSLTDAILTLRGRATWAHNFDPARSISATFQTLPGASFVVNGAAQTRDAALTSASAEVKFASGLSLAATFEGELSDVTASYAGKGIVRYAW
jgi:uncharacterized protein with beta-barrel porin domain